MIVELSFISFRRLTRIDALIVLKAEEKSTNKIDSKFLAYQDVRKRDPKKL